MTERPRLGDLLVSDGIVTREQLETALERQKTSGQQLGQILTELGFLTEAELTRILSKQLSLPWVSLYHVEFSQELLKLIPAQLADQYGVIPVYVRKARGAGNTLYIAMEDPTNAEALDAVARVVPWPVRPMVAAPADVRNLVRLYYFGEKGPVANNATAAARKRGASSMPPPPPPVVKESRSEPGGQRVHDAAPQATGTPSQATGTPSQATTTSNDVPERPGAGMTFALLDGTIVKLPVRRKDSSSTKAVGTSTGKVGLGAWGAEDLAALSKGRWEPFVAALLELLMRKGIVADEELLEELRKQLK